MKIGQHRTELARRVAWLNSVALVVFSIIALSYWWVQVVHGQTYRALADNNRLRKVSLEAPRGLIYDRHGRQLVENVPSYSLLLDRSLTSNLEGSLAFASEILEIEPEELKRRVTEARSGRFQQVRIAENLDLSRVARFRVQQLEYPEFEIAAEHSRLNRHAKHTAHLLGYLGKVTKTDLDNRSDGRSHSRSDRLRANDLLGRKGIERYYEDHLRGVRGEQKVVVDSRGRLVEEHEPITAHPGGDLHLTLDLGLQQEAARQLGDKVGAVVALDPRQGDVLALYSSPSFDPNAFTRGLSIEEWEAVRDDPRRPLQNRALQPYSPGSIFKIVMALAALDQGVISPQTRVFCSGSTKIYNHRRRCHNAGGHGWENFEDALRDSCDIFFYELGQKMNIRTIAKYARMFGMGQPTGIPLQGENRGLVPDPDWSQRVRKTPWYLGETISVAIGQGPIENTPLQAATLMAAVARGRWITPRLVMDEPTVVGEALPFSAEHLRLVREALYKVVNAAKGTGKASRVEGLGVVGKTGTVQVIRQETWTSNEELAPKHRDHAWFVSYAPAEDPRLVIAVFVEHGGAGSKAAAPIARALYEKYFAERLKSRPTT